MERTGIRCFALILVLGVAACSGMQKKGSPPISAVDRSDGISRAEAVVLAQKYIVAQNKRNSVKSLTPFEVEEAFYWCTLNEISCYADDFSVPPALNCRKVKGWRVGFKSLEGAFFWGMLTLHPYYVAVSSETGEILQEGMIKK